MANRYWVGGTASWDGTAGTKWALTSGGAGGQAVPTSADDVFFDANSTGVVTIATGNTGAKSITCTGFTGTLTGTANITVSGSVTLVSGMTMSYTGGMTIAGTGTITSAGKTFGSVIVNASGITVTLGDAFTSSSTLTLTYGTLNANNFNVTASTFTSSNSNLRTLTMGSGTWTMTSTGGGTLWSTSTGTNLTLNANTSTIVITGVGDFLSAGFTYYNVSWPTGTTGSISITGNNSFNNLSFTGASTAAFMDVVFSGDQTVAGTLTTSTGTSAVSRICLRSSGGLVVRTLTCAAVSLIDTDFQNITISGAAAPATGTRLGNGGNNSGITFPAAKTVYWNLSGAQSWSATGWATSSGGSPAVNNFPLAQDTAVFDNTAGSVTGTITLNDDYLIGTLDMSGRTSAMTLATSTLSFDVIGNWINGTGVTLTGTGAITFSGGTAQSITPAGITFPHIITILSPNGTVTLAGAMTVSQATTLSAGTLALAGFTLSTNTFSSSNSNARVIDFGSGNIALTTTTAGSTMLSMATANGFTFTGTGGFTRNMAASATATFGSSAGGSASNAPNLTVNAGASTLTITSGSYFKNLVFTGSTSTVTVSSTSGVNLSGNLTLASGGTYTALPVTFLASATITSSGKTLNSVVVSNSTSDTITLADACTIAANRTFTLNTGTLDLNGFTLSTGSFSSSGASTRAISFGSQNIVLTSTTSATAVLGMSTASGFTFTGTGGFIRNQAATATVQFGSTAGGSTSNAPNLTVNAGTSTLTITSSSWFKNLDFTGSPCTVSMASGSVNIAGNLTLDPGGTYTTVGTIFQASGTITSNGKTLSSAAFTGSGATYTLADAMTLGTTSTATLTNGTLNLAGFNLSTGNFSSSGSSTRAIAFGTGNIALTSTTASTTVLGMSDATNFTWTGVGAFTRNQAATATVSFGGLGGSTSNAPNLLVNAGASTLTINNSWFKNLIFTGSTCTVSVTTLLRMAGDLTLDPGGTYTAVNPSFQASGTITSNGKTLSDIQISGSGTTVTLADALSSAGSLSLTSGTFTAANFNVTTDSFVSSNSNTRTLNMGSGTWTLSGSGASVWSTATTTGLALNPSTSTVSMTSASAKTFAGGGLTYYNLNQGGTGALTISGSNTFNNITNTTQPATVTFTAGTTQTVSNFGLSGTFGNLVAINSSTPGAQFTLSDSSGTISPTYLSITDSYATGGATWDATGAGNVDGGNNTGWIGFASGGGGGRFLLLM